MTETSRDTITPFTCEGMPMKAEARSSASFDCDISAPVLISCESLRAKCPERVSLVSSASPLAVYRVSDVFFLGRYCQALSMTGIGGDNLHVLEESWTYNFEAFPSIALKSLADTTSGSGVLEEAFPLCFIWAENFWHWIFEGLTRVAVLEAMGFRGTYIVPPFDHAMETMIMMQVPRHRLVLGQRPYFVKQLLVSGHMPPDRFTPGTMYALQALHKRFAGQIPRLPGKKRCYLKRLGNRKVRNEREVISMLEPLGFEVTSPEEQPSIMAQFTYISNAECSIMPHGANCALAFGQPRDAHFIELFGMGYVNNCNGPMVEAAGLQHHQITEKTTQDVTLNPDGDFEVDVDFLYYKVRKILRI